MQKSLKFSINHHSLLRPIYRTPVLYIGQQAGRLDAKLDANLEICLVHQKALAPSTLAPVGMA